MIMPLISFITLATIFLITATLLLIFAPIIILVFVVSMVYYASIKVASMARQVVAKKEINPDVTKPRCLESISLTPDQYKVVPA